MTEIKVKDKTYLFVEVPDDAYKIEFAKIDREDLFDVDDVPYSVIRYWTHPKSFHAIEIQESENFNELNDYKIISTTKKITEEQAESIVEDCEIYAKCWKKYDYYGERDKGGRFNAEYSCWTAKESLQSLLQANGLDINKNYLILLKSNQNAKEI